MKVREVIKKLERQFPEVEWKELEDYDLNFKKVVQEHEVEEWLKKSWRDEESYYSCGGFNRYKVLIDGKHTIEVGVKTWGPSSYDERYREGEKVIDAMQRHGIETFKYIVVINDWSWNCPDEYGAQVTIYKFDTQTVRRVYQKMLERAQQMVRRFFND